jgi:type I restriction enzyme S subunit
MKSAASKQTSANLKENGDAVPITAAADRMSSRSSELPEGWHFADLRSVCERTSIWNPARERRDRFRYIDVSSVSNEHFCVTGAQEIAGSSAPSRARKIVKTGDVIYATVRPSLKRVAWIEPGYNDQIASTAFCIVRADPKQAVSKFLYYILLSDDVNRRIIEHERGASYPAVTDKDVLNQFVPLPPIEEQEKIAAVLWKIQKAVEIENAIVRNARDLKKSLLRRLFTHGWRGEPLKETEIGPLPNSWELVPFVEVLTMAQYGLSMRGRSEGRYPILRMNCQSDGQVTFDDLQFVDLEEKAFAAYELRDGDLLFNRTNSFELVGRTAIFHSDKPAVFASYLIRLRLDSEQMISDFVNYYLNMESTQQTLKLLATRAVSQSNISASKLKTFQIPKPEKNEQREIADILQSVDRKIEVHESKKRSLRDLFKTLLHKLMTAQIRVDHLDVDTNDMGALDQEGKTR